MGLDESMKQAQQAMEHSATIHEVSATADEVAATGNTISDSIQWVAELSKGTLDSCRRGQDDAEMAGQTIEQLQTCQSALRSELESLLHRSSRIREIIALIQGVVDQVDMLAVNAALEAAGAGEAGMRFSVVAKETKRLAGQTSAAVSDVRMILREIQDAINEFQRRHSQAMEAIEHQSGMVLDTAAALHEIVGLMERTATSAEQIRIGSGQQTEALNEVQRILSELNVSSESIAKGSGRVEKIMQDISNLARELRAVQKAETGIPGQEESESQQSESQAPLNKE
jgi:methyl-accepting chemotaxis protein